MPCKICESSLRTEIEEKDCALKGDQTIEWARTRGIRLNRLILARHRTEHAGLKKGAKTINIPTQAVNLQTHEANLAIPGIDDIAFLDLVRDRVYRKLEAGEMDLKLDSAFKAIEIKHRLSDESSNEKLLLEILAEIRADELKRVKAHDLPLTESA